MGLYSKVLSIGRIFAYDVWGLIFGRAYYYCYYFFLGGGALIIGILRYLATGMQVTVTIINY